jgi:hypothetical protein
MRRRLDADGEMVLARWLDHYQPDKETRRLIAEALDAYSEDGNQIRFHAEEDFSNPGVIVIRPEEGLGIHVQALGGERFTLVRIIDERDWTGE